MRARWEPPWIAGRVLVAALPLALGVYLLLSAPLDPEAHAGAPPPVGAPRVRALVEPGPAEIAPTLTATPAPYAAVSPRVSVPSAAPAPASVSRVAPDPRARGGCRACVADYGLPEPEVEDEPPLDHGCKLIVRLPWVSRHQAADGRWSADELESCTCDVGNHDRPDPRLDVERTALALFCYASRGESHCFGYSKSRVSRALRWLRDQQDARGWVAPGLSFQDAARAHALATLALAELYAVSRDVKLRRHLDAALRVAEHDLAAARDPLPAATVGWLLVALRAAETAGVEVSAEALTQLVERTSLSATDPLDLAVGAYAAYWVGGEPRANPELIAATRRLATHAPRWRPGAVDLERWYFTAAALSGTGERDVWSTWRRQLEAALLESQCTNRCATDSWDPIGARGAIGGRAWTTAMAILCLEVGYRVDRIEDH